ncbi:glutaredoxin family protein [Oerskovia sp. Sa1BUA8]|uniref:Glutaredoxin-like protein NrdH n=1 Tax=Oerskovia douganii TaxID=2762210 RepID=A0A9D5UDU2_9CELL|nr:glutaredoxin family protein [Oerskovia douganii]MBE7701226.1 glutaredoxin family protein [Oerskovia douganii]
MTVTVYTQPACMPCLATKRLLNRQGIPFTEIDLTTDPTALELVRSLNHQSAPVVIAGDTHWSGYRPDQIHALTKEN